MLVQYVEPELPPGYDGIYFSVILALSFGRFPVVAVVHASKVLSKFSPVFAMTSFSHAIHIPVRANCLPK